MKVTSDEGLAIRTISRLAFVCLCLSVTSLHAADDPKFRTDDGSDKSLPWFQLVDGKFPSPNSARAISGELIQVDHLERRFQIRVDRNDTQQAGYMDLPLDGVMLPYGSIYYHGAPADLQDIPLGTHLHGLFYTKAADDKAGSNARHLLNAASFVIRRSGLRLEDDFSYYTQQKQSWQIDSINLAERKLTATLQQNGAAVGKAKTFDLQASTRVRKGSGLEKLDSLAPGQIVQFNITWATLYGAGRILEIWLDEPSRELATAQQLERHRDQVRDRGLPGWIDEVDDDAQIVTITFFDNVDPKLFDELKGINEEPHGWPFSKREDDPKAPKGALPWRESA
ncbi:MAG: hypothetical protein JWP89_6782 [Schlesneria sp.]|nr:hypothetical protein [Schlesneria sp.]